MEVNPLGTPASELPEHKDGAAAPPRLFSMVLSYKAPALIVQVFFVNLYFVTLSI